MIAESDPRLRDALREIRAVAGIGVRRLSDDHARRSLVIGVTSPRPGDGKSAISMALAGSLTYDLGLSVALADMDFQTRSIGREYGILRSGGISEVLAGAATLDSITYQPPGTSLSVVPAGNVPSDPGKMTRSETMQALVESLRMSHRYVVLDLPSVLASTEAAVVGGLCDGIIVVARAGRTTRDDLERTLHLLGDANVLGVVLNQWETALPSWLEGMLGLRR